MISRKVLKDTLLTRGSQQVDLHYRCAISLDELQHPHQFLLTLVQR